MAERPETIVAGRGGDLEESGNSEYKMVLSRDR